MTGSNEQGRGSWRYNTGVAVAIVTSFLTVWTTIVRDDGNGIGFFLLIMAAGVGGYAARFQTAGMARTMAGRRGHAAGVRRGHRNRSLDGEHSG